MRYKVTCPSCGHVAKLQEESLGGTVHCVCRTKYDPRAAGPVLVSTGPLPNTKPVQDGEQVASAYHKLWAKLHRYAHTHRDDWDPAAALNFYYVQWRPRIPGTGCACGQHWAEWEALKPIEKHVLTPDKFFWWGYEGHDFVSRTHSGAQQLKAWQAYKLWHGPSVGWLAAAYLPQGGTETHHRTLLTRLRHQVYIQGFVSTAFHGGRGSLLGVPYGQGLLAAQQLAASVDTLVVWGIDCLADILPAKRPRVISVHHGSPGNGWSDGLQINQAPLLDHVVCVHQGAAERLGKVLPYHVQTHHIANAPDPARVARSPGWSAEKQLASAGLAPGTKVLLWCHRMSEEKQPTLAHQIGQALPAGWALVMVGDGVMRPQLANTGKVVVLGPVAHPGDWLGVATVALATPDNEGYGLSTAEAMLAGVPVVSTPEGLPATPGVATLVPHGSTVAQWVEAVENATAGLTVAPALGHLGKYKVDDFVGKWASLLARP